MARTDNSTVNDLFNESFEQEENEASEESKVTPTVQDPAVDNDPEVAVATEPEPEVEIRVPDAFRDLPAVTAPEDNKVLVSVGNDPPVELPYDGTPIKVPNSQALALAVSAAVEIVTEERE